MDTLIDLETVFVELEDQFRLYIERKYLVHSSAVQKMPKLLQANIQIGLLVELSKHVQTCLMSGKVRPGAGASSPHTYFKQQIHKNSAVLFYFYIKKTAMFVIHIC